MDNMNIGVVIRQKTTWSQQTDNGFFVLGRSIEGCFGGGIQDENLNQKQ